MKVEVMYPGAYALIKAELLQGGSLKAESGAMVAMSPTIDVEGKVDGGVWGALKRTVLTGESLFFQTLKASRGAGTVFLAPSVPGDVAIMELNGANHYFLQKEGFLAGDSSLVIEAVSQGFFKGFMSGEGMFIQKVSGQGTLIVSSFGSIHKMTLAPGETFIVDNSHLVAWSGTVTYEVQKASTGWFSSWSSGEGFVCHVKGPGDVYIQTRNPGSFGGWIRQFIPSK
jgi:uncharacterized protein (TIGR00266 family)